LWLPAGVGVDVSVFYDRQQELEKYEFMMGEARGRLAVTLDMLTDALILVGQHAVYCTSARDRGAPALDVQAVLKEINGAKELVGAVMERLRLDKEERLRLDKEASLQGAADKSEAAKSGLA